MPTLNVNVGILCGRDASVFPGRGVPGRLGPGPPVFLLPPEKQCLNLLLTAHSNIRAAQNVIRSDAYAKVVFLVIDSHSTKTIARHFFQTETATDIVFVRKRSASEALPSVIQSLKKIPYFMDYFLHIEYDNVDIEQEERQS